MFIKLLDMFVNNSVKNDLNLLFKFRFFAAIMLFFCVLDALVLSLTYIKIFKEPLTYSIYIVSILAVFIALKFSNNIKLVSFLFILFCFGLTFSIINTTGGIYSHNMKWLLLIALFGIIFNYKPYAITSFIYLTIALIGIFYFYFIGSKGSRNDYDKLLAFSKTDFLVDHIVHLLAFTVVVLFYYILHNRLLINLTKKNKALKEQHNLNLAKAKELKKIKEKLEETNRDLKSYAFATSHDLKEPLRNITSFIQLLKIELNNAELSTDAEEYLNYVELGGKRMHDLVDNALTLSKIENINTNSFEKIDVNFLLKEVLTDLSNYIGQTNADVQFDNLPNVIGSRVAIKRLFQNLLSNAIKYAKYNVSPVVLITAELNNKHHIFSIADNGTGINKMNLKAVFTPYKRMDETREGTGLGLSICKKIVEFHKGKIWVESNEGIGSVFKFTIPIA